MESYKLVSDIEVEKILPNSKLKNKDLRVRTDLSPLLKTSCHRYNHDSEDIFQLWFLSLTQKEQMEVVKFLNPSTDYLLKIFHNENVTITYEDSRLLKQAQKRRNSGIEESARKIELGEGIAVTEEELKEIIFSDTGHDEHDAWAELLEELSVEYHSRLDEIKTKFTVKKN